MAYRLAIWRGAQRDLKRFGPQERARIVNAMKSLEDEPLNRPDVTSMKALAGFFRLRVGDYRIIFTVEGDTVGVALVGHRKDVYEKLRRRI